MLLNNPHHTRPRSLVHFSARKNTQFMHSHVSYLRSNLLCDRGRAESGCRRCFPRLSGVKNNCGTHSHTFMSFFRTPQNASISSLSLSLSLSLALSLSLSVSPSVHQSSKGPPHSSVVLLKEEEEKEEKERSMHTRFKNTSM